MANQVNSEAVKGRTLSAFENKLLAVSYQLLALCMSPLPGNHGWYLQEESNSSMGTERNFSPLIQAQKLFIVRCKILIMRRQKPE